jgi:hypothetical protein
VHLPLLHGTVFGNPQTFTYNPHTFTYRELRITHKHLQLSLSPSTHTHTRTHAHTHIRHNIHSQTDAELFPRPMRTKTALLPRSLPPPRWPIHPCDGGHRRFHPFFRRACAIDQALVLGRALMLWRCPSSAQKAYSYPPPLRPGGSRSLGRGGD